MHRNQRGIVVEILLVLLVFSALAFVAFTVLRSIGVNDAKISYVEGPLRGVAFTPKSFGREGVNDFYEAAGELGNSVSWHGRWEELESSSSAPNSVTTAARRHGLEPIILVGTHNEQNGTVTPNRLLTEDTLADYQRWAVDFAQRHKPRYFGLGNEVNNIYTASPDEFATYVSLFNTVASAVKEVSPETQVFASFQLERMKGLNGGLFGGDNDSQNSQWALLARFTEADLFAFTTYPGLIYQAPEEIPADYYSQISTYTDKPIAFSEVGWPAQEVAAGWPSNITEQSDFARRFLGMTDSLDTPFRVWLLLYDQPEAPAAFRSMGLIEQGGDRRPAFNAWKID